MNISDIKYKDIRELAELRRSEQGLSTTDFLIGAFNWGSTPEKEDFWRSIFQGDFSPYHNVYPNHEWRQPTFQRGEEVEVRDSEDDLWQRRIFLAEIKGSRYPFCTVAPYSESAFKSGDVFEFAKWKYCRKIEQPTILTLQMIADKFNLPVDEIKVI
jgi:hypothetical protein